MGRKQASMIARLPGVSRAPPRIHCRALVPASKFLPMFGKATLTTVPSRKAIPEPATATVSSQRLALLWKAMPLGEADESELIG